LTGFAPSVAQHVQEDAAHHALAQRGQHVPERGLATLRSRLGQLLLIGGVDEHPGSRLLQQRRQPGVVVVEVGEHDGVDVRRRPPELGEIGQEALAEARAGPRR
jgi:hypothetical protein